MGAADSREAELEAQLRYERGLRPLLQDRVAHLERALASHGVTMVAELAGLSGLSMKDLGVAGDAKGGAGKKRKKDPDRPKRATTAYLVFCERHRKTVMRKNPELRSKQVTTELARLWQASRPASAPSARKWRRRTRSGTSTRWRSTASASGRTRTAGFSGAVGTATPCAGALVGVVTPGI